MTKIENMIQKFSAIRDVSIVEGKLTLSSETTDDAGKAIDRLRQFGGEGWLCATDSPEIRRFSPSSPMSVSAGCFPLSGEAVSGKRSLHLHRVAEGWELVTLIREDSSDGSQVLVSTSLKARDGQGWLSYETAWEPEDVAGLQELRPYASRFTGFLSRSQEA